MELSPCFFFLLILVTVVLSDVGVFVERIASMQRRIRAKVFELIPRFFIVREWDIAPLRVCITSTVVFDSEAHLVLSTSAIYIHPVLPNTGRQSRARLNLLFVAVFVLIVKTFARSWICTQPVYNR